jgi:hypothetical protein
VKVDTPHSDPARGGAFSQRGKRGKEFEMRRIFSFILAASLLFAPSARSRRIRATQRSDSVRSSRRRQRCRHAGRGQSPRSSMASASAIIRAPRSPRDQPNDRRNDQRLCRRDHAVFRGGLGNGASFTVTDSKVRATDTIILSVKSGTTLMNFRDGGGGGILPGHVFHDGRHDQRPTRRLSISRWFVRPRRNLSK